MASNSEKTSQPTDRTPEFIRKIVSEVGESQEKLRAVLNLLFVPRFKPGFIDPRNYSLSGLKDVEFLETPDTGGTQRPFRMFDLDTGNLVEHWTISPLDPYCMLSHRWRGDEITLAYVRGARAKDVERTLRNGRSSAAENETKETTRNDVQLVRDQCKHDVLEQKRIIKLLIHDALEQEQMQSIKRLVHDVLAHERIIKALTHEDLGDLLKWRIEAKSAMAAVELARKKEDSARSNAELARMEKVMFDGIINRDDGANVTPSPATTESGNVTLRVVNGLREKAANAKTNLEKAQEQQKSAQEYADFFDRNSLLREAVDEMVSCLQRWKSAIKIYKSIENAKGIFESRLFPKRDKRYLWLDTCCIDKQNHGELSQSLSLMGDWYAQAEFCLAQLDTDWREEEVIDDWIRFKTEENGENYSPGPEKSIIKIFDDIGRSENEGECNAPEWARRGWTLQELLVSKMAFFANSEWTLLSRPVEFLGYFYPLIPFIELYTRGDTMNIYSDALKAEGGKQPDALEFWSSESLAGVLKDDIPQPDENLEECVAKFHPTAVEETDRVKKALRLIFLLDGLGLRMPNDMTRETAISQMARAVYLAATSLVEKGASSDTSSRKLFDTLKKHFLPKTQSSEEREAQDAINFLLTCLVSNTKSLIAADRSFIAKFGQVNQLDTWKQGIRHSGFSTQRVMELSCKRISTIPTDHVYALMGILGIRFPTFPAEGYSKALSRLLDEVLITHNDVSVFNWTGVQMGSPIRGRSLYPASHEAFRNDEDRGRRYNMVIAAEGQEKRRKVMATYHSVIQMLRDAIDCIRDKERKGLLPLNWIQEIASLIQKSTFDNLEPELDSIGKILGYIKYHCGQPPPPKKAMGKPAEGTSPTPSPGENTASSFKIRPSFSGLKLGAGKKESDSPTIKTSKFSGFGKGMKPSFGKNSSEVAEKPVAEEPATLSPDTSHRPDDELKSSFDDNAESYSDGQHAWKSLDTDVAKYLTSIDSASKDKHRHTLPPEIQKAEFKAAGPEHMTRISNDDAPIKEAESLISPNPIIISNSGIEGIFDIQRIIVTMIDREKLLQKVAKAASPTQKVSGWCTLSTGFASVVVNFACEQRILRTQLEVVKTVEDRVIREEVRAEKLHRDLEIEGVGEKKSTDGGDTPSEDENVPDDGNDGGDLGGVQVKDGEDTEEVQTKGGEDTGEVQAEGVKDTYKRTKEERMVARIIDFIQEPDLQLVAGEWVLARFSGVRGAKWFLCYLELGSTHQFYGHRIATSDIDFATSAVESGLETVWETYMNRKKTMMCSILMKYLDSSGAAWKGKDKLSKGLDFAGQGFGLGKGMGVKSPQTAKPPPSPANDGEKVEDSETDESDSGTLVENSGQKRSLLDGMRDQSKQATMSLGEHTVRAIYEKLLEMHAKHLDKHLAVSVLKKTPKSLQTAVENMDENKNFLPAMFHSATRVHMF
ncbi:hypothetical protein DL768_010755 [Monosporascus sp. mg162]|nr:hypothetical protein DL768_010755 [Monosporascus sp. mg162]